MPFLICGRDRCRCVPNRDRDGRGSEVKERHEGSGVELVENGDGLDDDNDSNLPQTDENLPSVDIRYVSLQSVPFLSPHTTYKSNQTQTNKNYS